MENLGIDNGLKRIQINNDPNRVIEFNPSDVLFAERFYKLVGDFDTKLEEYRHRLEKIDANQEVDHHGIPVNFHEKMNLVRETCMFFRAQIDFLFGEGTSQIAFGDELVLDAFAQFFKGISPFIQVARTEKVAKYQKQLHNKRIMK
jgi:hypothetical protein